jgi:uncharacterized protein (DUF2384 family)
MSSSEITHGSERRHGDTAAYPRKVCQPASALQPSELGILRAFREKEAAGERSVCIAIQRSESEPECIAKSAPSLDRFHCRSNNLRVTIRAKMIAALEQEQSLKAKRIEKLKTCDLGVLKRAVSTFGSPEAAGRWLIEETNERSGLGGEAPIDAIETAGGRKAVLELLGRIDYGAYT